LPRALPPVEAKAFRECQEQKELLALKPLLAELKFALALRCFERKYRPDQPRDEIDRWVDDSRSGNRAQGPIGGIAADFGIDDAGADFSIDDIGTDFDVDDTATDFDIDDAATDFSSANRMPRIPQERPPASADRTSVARRVAEWLRENADAAVSTAVVVAPWLRDAVPNILSYFDPPRSLAELQDAANDPQPGYDIHHIVEQSSARADGYPTSRIDGPDNRVRIPRMKHWDINGWYQRSNPDFGDASPRDYLRQKDWDERERVGLDALRQFGILKP
jgi:hypothetical protein